MSCLGNEAATAPLDDQFELTIFGPGYGECITLHLGGGRWLVIDSCLTPKEKRPAALAYFDSIGVDPSTDVVGIIVTHWDDDHIRGLSTVVGECKNARVVISDALATDEFFAYAARLDQTRGLKVRSGVSEFLATLEALADSGRVPTHAILDRPIPVEAGDPFVVELVALSPSDAEVRNSRIEIASSIPELQSTKRVSVSRRGNHLSVVTLCKVGDLTILLGGDLEEDGDPSRGWSNILNESIHKKTRSEVFKCPHHASSTADHADVWAQMLAPSPITVTTPWSLGGRRLPSANDMARVMGHTELAFLSATQADGKAKKRPPAVSKKIASSVKSIRRIDAHFGAVRLRSKPGSSTLPLSIELCGDAAWFADAIAA